MTEFYRFGSVEQLLGDGFAELEQQTMIARKIQTERSSQ